MSFVKKFNRLCRKHGLNTLKDEEQHEFSPQMEEGLTNDHTFYQDLRQWSWVDVTSTKRIYAILTDGAEHWKTDGQLYWVAIWICDTKTKEAALVQGLTSYTQKEALNDVEQILMRALHRPFAEQMAEASKDHSQHYHYEKPPHVPFPEPDPEGEIKFTVTSLKELLSESASQINRMLGQEKYKDWENETITKLLTNEK